MRTGTIDQIIIKMINQLGCPNENEQIGSSGSVSNSVPAAVDGERRLQ